MNCKNCGAPLNETDKFCQNCGMVVDQAANMNSASQDTITTSTMNQNPVQNEGQILGTEGNQNVYANANTMQTAYTNTPSQQVTQPMNSNGYAPINNGINQKPKNNNIVLIVMGAVIVILLVVVIVLALNGSKSNTPVKTGEEPTTTTPTNTKNTNTTEIVLDNYTLTIPNEYTQEYVEDGIQLYTDEKCMFLGVLSGYSLTQIDMEMTKANIEASGYTVIESGKKQYNGVNMAVFGIDASGQKTLVVYAEIENKGLLAAEIMNISGELDYDLLENEFASIAKSAKYQSSSNSIATNDAYKKMEKFIGEKK